MPQTHTQPTLRISVAGLEQVECALCREQPGRNSWTVVCSRLAVSLRSGTVLRNRRGRHECPSDK